MLRSKGVERLPIRGSSHYATAETMKVLWVLTVGRRSTQHTHGKGGTKLQVWSQVKDFFHASVLHSATESKDTWLYPLLPWFLAQYSLSCYSGRETKSWLFVYRMQKKKKNGREACQSSEPKDFRREMTVHGKTDLWRETAQAQGKKLTGELLYSFSVSLTTGGREWRQNRRYEVLSSFPPISGVT